MAVYSAMDGPAITASTGTNYNIANVKYSNLHIVVPM